MSTEILNITIYQGNANHNHNEVSPCTCWHGWVSERVWRKGNPCTLLVGMKIGPATQVKQHGASSNQLETELFYHLAGPLLSIFSEELESASGTDICTTMLLAALLAIARTWKEEEIKKMWQILTMAYNAA